MIDYRFNGRLTYIPGGALSVQMSAWPVVGGNWWEPTTGSYTVVAAYQAKGAASLAASYVNLANPGTYDLTSGSDPSWNTATGWTITGTNILRMAYTPSNVAATFLFRIYTATAFSSNSFTLTAGTGLDPNTNIRPNVGGGRWYRHGSTVNLAVTPALTGANVIGMAGATAYRNGSSEGTMTQNTGASGPLNFGNRHDGGRPMGGDMLAVAIYSTTLDATQVAEITTNMQAL